VAVFIYSIKISLPYLLVGGNEQFAGMDEPVAAYKDGKEHKDVYC